MRVATVPHAVNRHAVPVPGGYARRMDIRDFIAARLDERERSLPSTLPGPWSTEVDRGKMQKPLGESEGHYLLRAGDGTLVAESVRGNALLHLRGHDPAWALRDITAKRQILADHPPLPDYTEAELHAYSMHPEWEYATTEGQRKAWDRSDIPPDGEGWERNTDKGRDGWDRLDFTEESYWRRRLPPEQVRARSEPRALRLLASIDANHPDFSPAWKADLR